MDFFSKLRLQGQLFAHITLTKAENNWQESSTRIMFCIQGEKKALADKARARGKGKRDRICLLYVQAYGAGFSGLIHSG